MSEPITIKMKLADPEQVTALITTALQEHYWHNEDSEACVPEMVRSVNAALVQAGCVVIQIDNSTAQ